MRLKTRCNFCVLTPRVQQMTYYSDETNRATLILQVDQIDLPRAAAVARGGPASARCSPDILYTDVKKF